MTRRAWFRSDTRLSCSLASLLHGGLAMFGAAFLLAACGSSNRMTAKEPGGLELPISIDHEPCDLSRGRAVDVNGDGRPDIVHVEEGGREVCRMVDLNFDGRPDAFIYFDAEGHVRRRESDFDRDGRIDEIATFSRGVVVRKDRDTNLDGKLDTWDFYESGKLVRRLRDTGGTGRVAQWWSFPKPDKPECTVIQSDRDGDGRPDPDELVDTCAESREAPQPPPASASPAPVARPDSAPDPETPADEASPEQGDPQ